AAGVEGHTFHLRSRTEPSVTLREWRRLRAEIRVFRPEVVHAQYGTATAFLTVLATNQPLIVTFRGSDLNPDPDKGFARCLLSRLMSQVTASRAERIICVSEQLLRRLWWGRKKSLIIPSGIDTKLFRPRCRTEARA